MPALSSMKMLRLDQLLQGLLQLALIFSTEESGLQLALVYPGLRGQHAAQQRVFAHFQAEDCDDGLAVDGRILGNIDGQRGLSHGRARGDDDEFILLQAAWSSRRILVNSVASPVTSRLSL